MKESDWLLKNFHQSENGLRSYHGEQNRGYHVKEHKKLSQKQVSKVTLHFVWGQLSRKQTVEQVPAAHLSHCAWANALTPTKEVRLVRTTTGSCSIWRVLRQDAVQEESLRFTLPAHLPEPVSLFRHSSTWIMTMSTPREVCKSSYTASLANTPSIFSGA